MWVTGLNIQQKNAESIPRPGSLPKKNYPRLFALIRGLLLAGLVLGQRFAEALGVVA
jgi:hypothetical protein